MSFVAGFTAGLMVGKKKFGGSGGSGDELWTPPADWLEVPEPGPWEANFLIQATDNMEFGLRFGNPENGYLGFGNLTVDWGDGTVDEFYESIVVGDGTVLTGYWSDAVNHTYSAAGQYIIRATADNQSNFFYNIPGSAKKDALLIAKLGSNIYVETLSGNRGLDTFRMCYHLKWVEIKSDSELPENCFNSCYRLQRVDLAKKITQIPNQCFSFCYGFNFRNIDFSEVTEIGVYGMEECCGLTKISAPQCTSVSNQAFYQCYALETATFAENCTFGTNAFQNCYNLYPRPDGSTN